MAASQGFLPISISSSPTPLPSAPNFNSTGSTPSTEGTVDSPRPKARPGLCGCMMEEGRVCAVVTAAVTLRAQAQGQAAELYRPGCPAHRVYSQDQLLLQSAPGRSYIFTSSAAMWKQVNLTHCLILDPMAGWSPHLYPGPTWHTARRDIRLHLSIPPAVWSVPYL